MKYCRRTGKSGFCAGVQKLPGRSARQSGEGIGAKVVNVALCSWVQVLQLHPDLLAAIGAMCREQQRVVFARKLGHRDRQSCPVTAGSVMHKCKCPLWSQ